MELFRLRNGNYRNQKFNGSALLLVALALACFAISPMVQAVVPAPDGGYPGGNTAEGQNALFSLTTGGFNTAAGWLSLRSNIIGNFNTAIGAGTLLANTADENTATGAAALLSNTVGFANTADGALALFSNTGGNGNTAIGVEALRLNSIGSGNTAVGAGALLNNSATDGNTATGFATLPQTIGSGNTANGFQALKNATTGNSNTAVGIDAGSGVITANNVISIGATVAGADISDTCFIGNIRGVTTQNADAIPVLIDSAGQLGTASSSRRFKKEIKPMDQASEAILALKPVTFHYKSDKTNRPEFGLIAEEVAEVNPDLVVCDNNGDIYTVRYDAVNAMLLNEFLKEHYKVEQQAREMQEQEATISQLETTVAKQEVTIARQSKDFAAAIAQQENEIQSLTTSLKKQAAQIQKVSAQTELNRPAPQQVVLKTP